jgi:prepilin-type N-terminal cleavage/methylation domain-containing protein
MKKGFTLIELLVVISIIGVLTALLLSNFVGIRGRAKDAKLKSNLEQMKTSLRLYYNDYQQYPTSSSGAMEGCGAAGTATCTVGSEFSAGASSTVYMKELAEFDEYVQTSSGDGFYAGVVLSNASDAEIASSVAECAVSSPVTSAFYVCAD